MNTLFFRKALSFCFLSVITCTLSVAKADTGLTQLVDSATAQLKTCLYDNVSLEKTKKNPDAEAVFSACQEEYDALMNLLPSEVQMDAKRQIEIDINHRIQD